MKIIGVDPGTEESAYVLFDGDEVSERGIVPNDKLRHMLGLELMLAADKMAVEMIASYGMPVGKTTFETCLWIGRFIEAWGGPYELVYRTDVKMHICKDSRAKDANIRRALIERFPRTGGGSEPAIGVKKDPGPLYGFKSHLWAALAVAITSAETEDEYKLAA